MKLLTYFNQSIKRKGVILLITPIVLLAVFFLIYFPAQQRDLGRETAETQIRMLSDMLAFSVGAGLHDMNFDLVQTAFDWAKNDQNVHYVAIVDENNEIIFDYNPRSLPVNHREMLNAQLLYRGDLVNHAAPIRYKNENFGTIVLSYSLAEMFSSINSRLVVSIVVGLLIALGGLALVIFSISRITNQVVAFRNTALAIADGDLTHRIKTKSDDELGQLGNAFNKMVDDLHAIIADVREASEAVEKSGMEISSSSEQMAAGAQEQTSQTSEVAQSIEHMAQTIVENSQTATETTRMAERAMKTAETGYTVVGETINGMREIAQVVRNSAVAVQSLGKSGKQIGEIIGVIDDIADQTNLLALNAAIEAARAGEQGRGFAVVADEVRKLAERTTKATKEIAEMIKTIQRETTDAVSSMEQGTEKVDGGIKLADRAGESLQEIVDMVKKVSDMVSQIAVASEEQSSTSTQISQNVEAITAVTHETAKGTDQVARAAGALIQLTERLRDVVGKFRLAAGNVGGSRPVSRNLPDKRVWQTEHDRSRDEPQYVNQGNGHS
jgi:methyl-accepting chemotaxis protein